MKKIIFFLNIFAIVQICISNNSLFAQSEKITFEEIRSACENKPFNERVRVTVARFSVSTPDAQGEFGGELSTMLGNALQQTNCFRVLESIKNAEDMTGELSFGNSGMTQSGSSPETGKMLGAQIVITGEVTEFNDGRSNVSLAGLSVGADKARVGFIMKLVNPQTREVLFSRSINVLGKKNGFKGVRLLGLNVAGGSSQNQAVANAVEHAILEATSVLVDNLDNIALPNMEPVVDVPKLYNSSNCRLLSNGNPPSVMVIIPEVHILRKIPDPAGETEIIRKFINSGFTVIDPSVYDNIRESDRIQNAAKDANVAKSVGLEYGADIVIIGEAFSERAANQGNMISCRARVEARAVSTKDATIITAHGTHAGGVDITESSSAKVALANAGALMADYLLKSFCDGDSTQGNSKNSFENNNTSTNVQISKIDFNQFKKLQMGLEKSSLVSNVNKNFSGKSASFKINHSGSTDDILNLLMEVLPSLEVKSYADGKLIFSVK